MSGTVNEMKMYIEAYLKDGLNEDMLADELHFSLQYLREVFSRETNIPLGRYITNRKISNAAFDILYSERNLLEIALDYGYTAYDTFTRAFKRITGCKPNDFRVTRPHMERRRIGCGLYGIELISGRNEIMEKNIEKNEHGVLLYDVPRVKYGAYGGITPFPISLKACANYLGEDIDYADAITGCGAAFRLTWNTEYWDGSNVDVCHTYSESDAMKVYLQGITALGRSYRILMRGNDTSREDFMNFITECLQNGVPVIATGIVGPPEAGLITGYRDDGNTLLGWSVFQDWWDIKKDACGYYIQDKWWENGVDAVLAMGDKVCEKIDVLSTVKRAVNVMKPRTDGVYLKGLAAYDEWIADINNDSYFPNPDSGTTTVSLESKTGKDGKEHEPMEILSWRLMCHYDAIDCLADGRGNASRYFRRHEAENPKYIQVADLFSEVSEIADRMYSILGSNIRGEAQIRAISDSENRRKTVELIKKAKSADECAFKILESI